MSGADPDGERIGAGTPPAAATGGRSSCRFTGYHYRTSSRFGGHVEIAIVDEWVTVTGRRVARPVRDAWIWLQAALMAGAIGWLVVGVLSLSRACCRAVRPRRALTVSGILWWALYLVAALGALFLWWPADRGPRGFVSGFTDRQRRAGEEAARPTYSSLGFPLWVVRRARLSRWYWRRGLWLVAWPWQLVLLLAPDEHREVAFDVADPARPGRRIVFALAMSTAEEARDLIEILNRADSISGEDSAREA